jgi:hypothetical protein
VLENALDASAFIEKKKHVILTGRQPTLEDEYEFEDEKICVISVICG